MQYSFKIYNMDIKKKIMLSGLDVKYRTHERNTFTNDELHIYE